MTSAEAIDLVRQALMLVLIAGLPVLLTGLVVALVVSVLQALFALHDQTLSLVPRIMAMLLALVIFGPWMLGKVAQFGKEMFGPLP